MANYAGLGPSDFEEAVARKLLPRGLAWTRLVGSVLQGYWRVIADALAAVHARAAALTEVEGFPPTAVELLPDWETVLGLPDPCLGPNPVTAARQAAVKARLAQTGGQSIAYYQEVAVNLGGAIAVTEYAPLRFGVDHFGMPMRCAAWAYIWQASVSDVVLWHAQFGVSHFGEPFWGEGASPIVCELTRLKPAHTELLFAGPGGFFETDRSLMDTGAGMA